MLLEEVEAPTPLDKIMAPAPLEEVEALELLAERKSRCRRRWRSPSRQHRLLRKRFELRRWRRCWRRRHWKKVEEEVIRRR